MDKDKKLQDIERAFSLIETTDFQRFVDILKGQTLEGLEYWYQDRIKVLPDVDQISKFKQKRLAANEKLFEYYSNKPDTKLAMQNNLHTIARRLIFNEGSLLSLRDGTLPWLNMELVGLLWADSETLIKYRDKLLNWNKATGKTQPKPFFEYILHPDRERIAEALKSTFRGEKGKAIRLMIEVLNNQPQPLITYGNRQGKSLFDAMKLYFDWNIGTRQSIFDYKRINDEPDYKAIETRVLYILESIKNNK